MKKLLLKNLLLLSAITVSYAQNIDLETFANGFDFPVDIQNAGDNRLFIVEKSGIIKILNSDKQTQNSPFLDITNQVLENRTEQGLLGLAFDPNYDTNGYFYINYTRPKTGAPNGETVISRFSRLDTNTADPNSETVIFSFEQDEWNHNGGGIAFGPDGMLYVASGDGGGGNDAFDHGQDINTPLAAILRFDTTKADFKPADNPFIGQAGNDFIWHYGLRNPWRFSFDSVSGSLWIADVGDNDNLKSEEVNRVNATDSDLNFGWPCYEANNLNPNSSKANQCNGKDLTFPVNSYDRQNGRCSVTGGYVYRGSDYPNLAGKYVYADYCSGEIFTLENDGTGFTATSFSDNFGLTTFGESNTKELFVAKRNGTIYQVVDKDQTLSVNEFDKLDISISQNSNLSQLSINGLKETTLKDVSLISITGQNALNLLKNKVSNQTYNVKNISPGVYILLIETANNNKKAVKVLIN